MPSARLLRVTLLDTFACGWDDGRAVRVDSKKARGVLAYLALARTKSAPRHELFSHFWSSSGETQARQSLRQALSALRRALGDEGKAILVSDTQEVSLDASRVDVDVDHVLSALEGGDEERVLAAASVVRAGLLRDHVFGEAPADDWLASARLRIEGAAQQLIFRAVSLRQARGEEAEAIAGYQQILAVTPSCEEAHRGLMETYARVGRRSEALSQYRACEDALVRHLDAVPSQETARLFETLRAAGGAEPPPPRAAATLPLPDKPSIAVLAFDDLAAERERSYLGDGFSEDITTALAQFSSLFVIARNSAFTVKGRGLTVPEIGRQLGVHYVLEGSVQVAGERLRVTAQLVEAERGGHVWSERYDGTMRDVFTFRDDIVQRIVPTVAGRIEADALARAKRKATEDLDAYEMVLRGKFHHHRCTAEDSEKAVTFFRRAVEHRPDFVLAHAWLACGAARSSGFEASRTDRMNSETYLTWLGAAARRLERVSELDTEESECLRLIGEVYLFQRRHEEAERLVRRAHRYNPNDDKILSQLGAILAFQGAAEEAERFARRAMRANPYHPGFYPFTLARALMLLERYEEAIEALRAAAPPQNRYRAHLAACLAALGRLEEAGAVRDEILRENPAFTLAFFSATMLYRDPEVTERLVALMERAGLPA